MQLHRHYVHQKLQNMINLYFYLIEELLNENLPFFVYMFYLDFLNMNSFYIILMVVFDCWFYELKYLDYYLMKFFCLIILFLIINYYLYYLLGF